MQLTIVNLGSVVFKRTLILDPMALYVPLVQYNRIEPVVLWELLLCLRVILLPKYSSNGIDSIDHSHLITLGFGSK